MKTHMLTRLLIGAMTLVIAVVSAAGLYTPPSKCGVDKEQNACAKHVQVGDLPLDVLESGGIFGSGVLESGSSTLAGIGTVT